MNSSSADYVVTGTDLAEIVETLQEELAQIAHYVDNWRDGHPAERSIQQIAIVVDRYLKGAR